MVKPITSIAIEYFLTEQNLLVGKPMVRGLADNDLDNLKTEYGIRRGEHVVLTEKTVRLYRNPSRFLNLQPDGTNGFYSWSERSNDPATVKTVKTWRWTGWRWLESK